MNITFRQLKLFLHFSETKHISRAAQLMHVSQPTASMQLKEMTENIGLPLYDVIGKKCFLTDAGHELAKTARRIMETWETFEQYVDAEQGLSRGKLKIGVVSTAKYFMPRLMGDFCRRFPSIDISLEIQNRDGIVERLRNNLDDLYIMSRPPTDIDLHDEIFMPNPLVVIASVKHPLGKKKSIPLTDLQSQRFILREAGSGTRLVADEYFKKLKFKPSVRLELGSNESVKEAVAGDLGLGIISQHALHGHQRENGVKVLDVRGFPLESAWHVVYPAAKELSPVATAFKAHIFGAIPAIKKR